MTALLDAGAWTGRIFTGRWVDAARSAAVHSPTDGTEIGRIGHAGPDDVATAVGRARAAQVAWAQAPSSERVRVLRRAAALFEEHADEIAQWTAREGGAVLAMGRRSALVAADECHEAAALAAVPYGEVLRSQQPRLSLSRRMPVGVVGVIAPFNAPLLLAVRALAPALALGNAVVLKPDPRTAVCGGVVFAEVFARAGLPEGVLSVLPGGADAGGALVDHPDVPVLAFTGSTPAGIRIAQAAAARLKRVHLELGGNSALIVRADADIEAAAAAGAFGTFRHAGQICMAAGRHLVHESRYEEYLAALARIAESTVVGDPSDPASEMGPLIDATQRDRVVALVEDARSAGATVLTGGGHVGLFYQPTVIADRERAGATYGQEVFGPVATVTPFRDDDEAARLAADSEYGLSLGIITQDLDAALRLADRIPSGAVHINDQTINDEPVAPFGGVGASGNGARHGGHAANLEAFTELQWVTIRGRVAPYPVPILTSTPITAPTPEEPS